MVQASHHLLKNCAVHNILPEIPAFRHFVDVVGKAFLVFFGEHDFVPERSIPAGKAVA